ncbi:MAG: UDP-N-acetylmuramate--L-alanine ligase [Patescibacteria group bacterium]
MNKVHFIGIGGIGVSALARFYLAKGWEVSGSDLSESEITKRLLYDVRHPIKLNINIGHDAENVPDDVDKVIYSAAVRAGNPEMVRARDIGVPMLSYAETLGELTKEYFTIAVSGSHGKSTTTALLSLMLIKADLDPTIIVGTRLKEFGGNNFRLGQSKFLVIEADEWNNSFHYYHPNIIVLTNVDKEHLDTHKNLEGVIKNFATYIDNIDKKGSVIVNAQDKNSLQAIKNCQANIIKYNPRPLSSRASRASRGISWLLQIPGEFNQLNCEAAWQAAKLLGVKKKIAQQAVKKYAGSWRRMEYMTPIDTLCGRSTYINDYAHHPNEIKAVGKALREKYGDKKIIAIFQPHQIERLTNLFDDFTKAFGDFDIVGILPTYEVAGRELQGGKTSADLAKKIKAKYLQNFSEALKLIERDSVVVFMGAGDIDKEIRKYFKSKLF